MICLSVYQGNRMYVLYSTYTESNAHLAAIIKFNVCHKHVSKGTCGLNYFRLIPYVDLSGVVKCM